jgi:hypothetical protein
VLLMLPDAASRGTWARIQTVLRIDIAATFLSGLVSNNQITVIFYQPSHTDIQKTSTYRCGTGTS